MSKQFVSALPAACVASTSPSSIKNRMNTLIQQADAWDKGANITAKQQLYALLQQCYQLSAELSDLATEGEFRAYITEHTPKFRFRKNTSTISLILRTVFSARRRQVSAYNRALLVAQQAQIQPGNLIQHIMDAGGLENLRLQSGNCRPSASQLALSARQLLVREAAVATVPGSKRMARLWDSAAGDDFAVLVAKRNSDGGFSVLRVLQNPSVVSAALSKCTNTAALGEYELGAAQKKQQRRAIAVQKAVAAA